MDITYTDGNFGCRATTYVVGGSLVPFEGWNRLNEAGTWSATNGYIEDNGSSNANAYLYSNLNTGNLRFVATVSAPSGDYYDGELVALASGNNFYMIEFRQSNQGVGNDLTFYKVSNGIPNQLGSTITGIPWANGDTVEFLVSGVGSGTVTLACLRNGVSVGSETDSSSPYSSGLCGLGAYESNSNNWITEFSNVYVTNYVYPEPVQGAWGNEETVTVSIAPAGPVTLDVGQSQLFTATASGGSGSLSYQWYLDDVAVGTGASYSYTATAGSHQVYVNVTDSAGVLVTVESNTASVTVNSVPSISVEPSSATIDSGQSVTLSSTVTGGTGSFSWQWYDGSGLISGKSGTGVTASYTTSAADTGIYVVFTDTGTGSATPTKTATSSSVSVTVNSALVAPTASANHGTVNKGQTSSLTSTAVASGTGPYAYQWMVEAPGDSSFSVITGATSSSYDFVTGSSTLSGTWSFEVTVTDSASVPVTVTSNAVSVTVNSALVAPTASANHGTVNKGQTSSLTSSSVTTGTPSYTYQWLEKAPGDSSFSVITGATSSSYDFVTGSSTLSGTWSFEVTVTDSASVPVTVTSNAVSVTVNSALVAPTASANHGTVNKGQTSSLTSTAVASGTGPYAYQWMVEAPGDSSFSVITGATSSSYDFVTGSSTLSGTWSFEVTVTDSASVPVTVTSNAVSVTVNSALVAPTASANHGTVNKGQTSSLTSSSVTTGTPSYTYQWLEKAPGDSSFSVITGATSSSYDFVTGSSTLSGTWSFEVTVTDSASVPVTVTSNAVSVTVNSALVAPTASANHGTVNKGQTSSLTSSCC